MELHPCQPGSAVARAECGFTLLEVIVAFIIAAMALGAMVNTSATALRATHNAGQMDEALARAASHVAIVSAAPLVDSDRQGDEGRSFHWHVRVTSAGTVRTAVSQESQSSYTVTLYKITVTITWVEGGYIHAVRLDSAQLGLLS